MYDKFDNTYQVSGTRAMQPIWHSFKLVPACPANSLVIHPSTAVACLNHSCMPQATIGIDFLSKTMYLEDRTVRLQLW
jgi:hypothetical protein